MLLDEPTLHSARDLRSQYLSSLLVHGWKSLNRFFRAIGSILKRENAQTVGDGSA
jgi:hypothetical protein